MAISVEGVKQIQTQTVDLGELILSINPVTDKEWDAFEKLVSAHKNLMKIDTDALFQLPLPFEKKVNKTPKPREDCPKCHGVGSLIDLLHPDKKPRPCNCKDVENIAWPQVKREWEEALAPAKV